jgi:hypothetical protein
MIDAPEGREEALVEVMARGFSDWRIRRREGVDVCQDVLDARWLEKAERYRAIAKAHLEALEAGPWVVLDRGEVITALKLLDIEPALVMALRWVADASYITESPDIKLLLALEARGLIKYWVDAEIWKVTPVGCIVLDIPNSDFSPP